MVTTKTSRTRQAGPKLTRQHFETSRSLDFLSRKELIAQTGHQVREWPLVCLKELVDNALDACEESGTAPVIDIEVDETSITVIDNGPGIPASVIESVLDFGVRVSSREAYVSPSRGAQGNALKTVIAMPFALAGHGVVTIESRGCRHEIAVSVDRIKQEPRVSHQRRKSDRTEGTEITVEWPDKPSSIVANGIAQILQNGDSAGEKPSSILGSAKDRFLQIAEDYCWLNPHLTLSVGWIRGGTVVDDVRVTASDPCWSKWSPSNPTDPHWYGVDEMERLIAANVSHSDRLVREFVSEFRGLSGSAKQKRVIEASGLVRARLSDLVVDAEIDKAAANKLLRAMQSETKPVKAQSLGVVGRAHLSALCQRAGGDPDTFAYKKVTGNENGLPWVIETCFAYCPKEDRPRRIIPGVNWSPGIINPFRQLGKNGVSLDSVLQEQRTGRDEPTVLVLHIACPRVRYADRGKSSVIVED